MGIRDLPKPGINFKATLGPGSFQRKLSSATRYGGLKNLKDNQKAIVETVKKYQGVIRIKGGLSRLQQLGAWRKIKASDKTVTKEDRREIKEVLKHLGQGGASRANKSIGNSKVFKSSGGGKFVLSEEQIKRNINRARRARMDEEAKAAGRGETYIKQYAGGREVESHGVMKHGTMEDLGVSWNKKAGDRTGGFAADYKNSKLPNNSAPKAPLTGTKPLGF
jgi:hypothetical protein